MGTRFCWTVAAGAVLAMIGASISPSRAGQVNTQPLLCAVRV